MAGLIELSKANLVHRNLTRNYLTAVIVSCDSTDHFRVVSNQYYTAVVEKIDSLPGEAETNRLSERLDSSAAFDFLAYEKGTIPTIITNNKIILTGMLKITHINPILLIHALKQEANIDNNANTVDLRAWTGLPKIIQAHWSRFNDQLRTHIMDCMMKYLENQFSQNSHTTNYQSTLFAGASFRQFPHIPVRLPVTGNKGTGYVVSDLMEALVTASHTNFGDMMPAERTDEVKFRFTTNTPSQSNRI